MRRKALLAIAFAGGLLNPHCPALSQDKIEPTASVIEQIATNANLPPEDRAYYLLGLASDYIAGADQTMVDKQFGTVGAQKTRALWLLRGRGWQGILSDWANRVASPYSTRATLTPDAKSDSTAISDVNRALADSALQQALTQLDKAADKFARLNLYFIASRLFERTGNTAGMLKCRKVLEQAFRSCEGNSSADEEQIKAAISVLNSMAYGLIPIQVPDWKNPLDQTQPKPIFSDADFRASDKLRRRALAFADRLPTTNHVRRKAHRDLAIWYMQLGKDDLAYREKQIVFDLVGIHDDSILYPQSLGCGSLLWWQPQSTRGAFGCGMG